MKKTILACLLPATIGNLIVLIIALTNKASSFYNYRFVIGISFLVFGGLLRKQILSYRNNVEE